MSHYPVALRDEALLRLQRAAVSRLGSALPSAIACRRAEQAVAGFGSAMAVPAESPQRAAPVRPAGFASAPHRTWKEPPRPGARSAPQRVGLSVEGERKAQRWGLREAAWVP